MSKELFLNPFKRDAAPPAKQLIADTSPAALARADLLPSSELAQPASRLLLIRKNVLFALRANFENFYASGLSRAASAPMRGFVKGDALYLSMLCADQNVSYRMGVRRIVRSLSGQHEKISATSAQFKSIKDPDAYLWVCQTKAMLDIVVKNDMASLEEKHGKSMEVISAELPLKSKSKGKETGEETTLFIALAR
ncbi:MAG: hypothetical protein WC861_04405 [Candidatus Micrarchaeia archaeon]|jgi:hypothetical protein